MVQPGRTIPATFPSKDSTAYVYKWTFTVMLNGVEFQAKGFPYNSSMEAKTAMREFVASCTPTTVSV